VRVALAAAILALLVSTIQMLYLRSIQEAQGRADELLRAHQAAQLEAVHLGMAKLERDISRLRRGDIDAGWLCDRVRCGDGEWMPGPRSTQPKLLRQGTE
jgi:hypothetical protein